MHDSLHNAMHSECRSTRIPLEPTTYHPHTWKQKPAIEQGVTVFEVNDKTFVTKSGSASPLLVIFPSGVPIIQT
jgi:hypothetical protein